MKPLFITFEGLDGSGKSSHLATVAERIRGAGVAVCETHEPGGTPFGERLREAFLDPASQGLDGKIELLLVFASRRHHLLQVIEPALRAGAHVLCDRFSDSTFAYQGRGRGVPIELITQVDRLATGSRVPDRTLLFDLPPEVARARSHSASRQRRTGGTADRLDTEELAFYRRVREGYLELARAAPERYWVIDSSRPREETARDVEGALGDLVELRAVVE